MQITIKLLQLKYEGWFKLLRKSVILHENSRETCICSSLQTFIVKVLDTNAWPTANAKIYSEAGNRAISFLYTICLTYAREFERHPKFPFALYYIKPYSPFIF